jgi:primosomal protein N''
MDKELLAILLPLIAAGLVGAVAWIIKLEVNLITLRKDNEQQNKDINRLSAESEKHDDWDRAQHKELFDRALSDAKVLERLLTMVENIGRNVDEILERERQRNGVTH